MKRKILAVLTSALLAMTAFVVAPNAAFADTATTLVKFDLKDSKGKALPVDEGGASYYSNGWKTFDPEAGVELAPGTYDFAAVYNGTRQQKKVTVVGDEATPVQAVDFKTSLVNVQLHGDHNIALDLRQGTAQFYAGGAWRLITGVNTNNPRLVQTEMLPGTYAFAATFNGTREQQNGVVVGATAKTVRFHAAIVDVELMDNGAVVRADSYTAKYYANGWRVLDNSTGVYMLPGTYTFEVMIGGERLRKEYTVVRPNENNNDRRNQTVPFELPKRS
ncbi:MAG: hypothetical protein QM705_09805 [Ancrocorticia sp.]